jgi:hypothetical protein
MKLALYIAVALLLAVGLLLAYAATRPDDFRVERRLRIAATPAQLWPLVGELRGFNRWNPYERKDPLTQGSYSGAAAGVGSRYAWESSKIGTGSLEITAQSPGQRVQMKLDFIKPFEAHNQAEFRLAPQADGSTEVTWAMQGHNALLHKAMGLIFNMDKLVGADFEQGLLNLQKLAEGHA